MFKVKRGMINGVKQWTNSKLKKEVKEELKGEFNETAVGYIHIFNKRLEEKLREQGIEYDKEKLEHKQID